jgi:hypothetical protein
MANWYGAARSNYFRVKDAEAFEADMAKYDVELWSKDENPDLLAMSAAGDDGDDGDWPSYDSETDEDFEFIDKVWPHLAEGEVLVMKTIGSEKMRYLTGYAVAVNHRGEKVDINLNNIYDLAKQAFKVDDITEVSY